MQPHRGLVGLGDAAEYPVDVLAFQRIEQHGIKLTPDPLPADDDEFIERRIVPLAEAVRMALDDEITESVSKMTLLQYVARPPAP